MEGKPESGTRLLALDELRVPGGLFIRGAIPLVGLILSAVLTFDAQVVSRSARPEALVARGRLVPSDSGGQVVPESADIQTWQVIAAIPKDRSKAVRLGDSVWIQIEWVTGRSAGRVAELSSPRPSWADTGTQPSFQVRIAFGPRYSARLLPIGALRRGRAA